jgi:hypothetical protein
MLEKLCKNRFSDETVDAVLITRISASSPTRDRNRSLAIPQDQSTQIQHRYQYRAILSQRPARLNLRQVQGWVWQNLRLDTE